MDWLINGEGEMIIVRSEENSRQQELQSTDSSVLVVPLTAHAGNLSQFTCSVYEYECERILSPIKGADFAVPVSGESMSPEYPSGSKVLVTKINEKAFIDWGKTYVLDTCNGVIIKNVYPSENEGFVKCVSVNPLYPPFELNIEDVYGWYKVLMCLAVK
jgi:phage repressor protein C with HTH and peptisase S24 domain